ncbi:BPL-N domain-containing protein [Bdellovibrionota bacterium FG-1]
MDALVYRGPGACDEGCSEAAAKVAQIAGLRPVFVGPSEANSLIFKNAGVWIQPGGTSRAVGKAMSAQLKGWIQDFVRSGGGYVGFCAGGFFATAKIGDLEDPGLGLLPGASHPYTTVPDDAIILPIQWGGGKPRQIYWEGGPFFTLPSETGTGAEVMATYSEGTAASVRAPYGKGRVYVTGLHPEAPQSWRDYFHLLDSDGLDENLAVQMIHWASRVRKP